MQLAEEIFKLKNTPLGVQHQDLLHVSQAHYPLHQLYM